MWRGLSLKKLVYIYSATNKEIAMIFERALNIPLGHTLQEIELNIRNFASPNEHWLHEEYDRSGNLIAKYISWHFATPRPQYQSNSGYRKYNRYGQLIQDSQELRLQAWYIAELGGGTAMPRLVC